MIPQGEFIEQKLFVHFTKLYLKSISYCLMHLENKFNARFVPEPAFQAGQTNDKLNPMNDKKNLAEGMQELSADDSLSLTYLFVYELLSTAF